MDKRCNNCFQFHNDDSSPCPYCGYIKGTPPKESFQLYPGTELLGRYIIGQVVGFGGFGTTYKAWDKLCNNVVAIKEYLPIGSVSRNPKESNLIVYTEKEKVFKKGLSRFIDEAASMMRFNKCDNIVNIYNYFEVNNTGYIVMELLEGQTLSSFLRKRKSKLPFDEVIEITRSVCEALENLHNIGMVHRDISPENIFMCSDGKVKLIDFGAARETLDEQRRMTIILKPGYAPPEQYESVNKQGPWTDIYAVGATLYLLLTGSKPQESTARMQSDKLIAPNKVDSNIPSYLSNLVMKAMALDIKKRYKTMEEFKQALLSKTKEVNKKNIDNKENEDGSEIIGGYNLEVTANETISKKRRKTSPKPIMLMSVALITVAVICLVILLEKKEFSSNASTENKDGGKKNITSEITIWFTFDEDSEFDLEAKKKSLKQIEKKYEKKNPHIDVKIECFEGQKYTDEIYKAFKKNKMPDIYESTDLPLEFMEDAVQMEEIVPDSVLNKTYGLRGLLTNMEYQYMLPLGFKLPMIYINLDEDYYQEGDYDYSINSFEQLDFHDDPAHILVDETTLVMYENFRDINECELTNVGKMDVISATNEFLRTDELFNSNGESERKYYNYFFGSTSNYNAMYDMLYVDKTSEIPVHMVFYTGDDANIEFINCFSVNGKSKKLGETKELFNYLYSKEAQEYMYLDGTGHVLPLSKKVLNDSYGTFFNDINISNVMKEYAIFQ